MALDPVNVWSVLFLTGKSVAENNPGQKKNNNTLGIKNVWYKRKARNFGWKTPAIKDFIGQTHTFLAGIHNL